MNVQMHTSAMYILSVHLQWEILEGKTSCHVHRLIPNPNDNHSCWTETVMSFFLDTGQALPRPVLFFKLSFYKDYILPSCIRFPNILWYAHTANSELISTWAHFNACSSWRKQFVVRKGNMSVHKMSLKDSVSGRVWLICQRQGGDRCRQHGLLLS